MIPLHDDNPTTRKPFVTIVLIAVNVLIFFFWQPKGDGEVEFLVQRAAIPCEVTTGQPVEIAPRGRDVVDALTCDGPAERRPFPQKNVYLALLTSMFLHANLLHIGGNMLFLWVFGNNVEDRMGHALYVLFYLGAGVVASFAHILLFRDSAIPVIGASGAIAGVMGAYLVAFPKARVLTLVPFLLFFTVRLPAWIVLGLWFVGQFTISASNSGVATAAHIGGFVAGLVVAFLFLRRPRPAAPAYYQPPYPFRPD